MSRAKIQSFRRHSVVVLMGLVIAAPIVYLISGSLMSHGEIISYPPKLFPADPQWINFAHAMEYVSARTIFNTLVFVGGVLILQLAVTLMAGFALARIPFRGRNALFLYFLVPIFVPTNLVLIPTFVVTFQMNLLGTFAGMILPVVAQASVGVLLFRQYFKTLPDGLFEAARLDGAGWFRVFFAIAVPLARPIIAAYSIVTFLAAWNMYLWPLLAGTGEAHRVLTVAIAPLAASTYSIMSPAIGFAAAVIAVAPVLLVFIVFQKWFTRGIVGTGLE